MTPDYYTTKWTKPNHYDFWWYQEFAAQNAASLYTVNNRSKDGWNIAWTGLYGSWLHEKLIAVDHP